MIGITILGSTGTIGVNTLDVIRHHPERFRVVALTANTDDRRLFEQCCQWQPQYAVMATSQAAGRLRERLAGRLETTVLAGTEALEQVARLPSVDYVMAGIVGAVGLLPTLAAAQAGKRVLLANKEALVMSGTLFMEAVKESRAELLPIDSEHNAVFQCLPERYPEGRAGVRRILLTASGGPFRNRPLAELDAVTPEQACAHPNWVMGRKISVDSATMMNKGLEVIEACWLFDVTPECVQVVVHPESVIHSMVEYRDGSVLAQLGNPDMRTPIAHALSWPERMESGVESLDLVAQGSLSFEAADFGRFPCLRLGYEAAAAGGTATTILNAANEVAVHAFLERRLRFGDIPHVIEATLTEQRYGPAETLDGILDADAQAREVALAHVARRAQTRGYG
ncbi:MAG: 1-deoxy-D-xylulose-5-phosphate reductoisomerase [Gammaproteobacteria bacterium]